MTPKERLIQFAQHKGLAKNAFCKKAGLSNGYLDKGAGLVTNKLEKIANAFPEINLSWVLTGKGVEELPLLFNPNINRQATPSEDQISIPITDLQAAAGNGLFNSEQIEHQDYISLPTRLIKKGTHLCIRIKGDSMVPILQNGGFALIRLLEQQEWADILQDTIYVVADKEGKTHIKRVKNKLREQGILELIPDNPVYPRYELKEHEITSIWNTEWYFTDKIPSIHDINDSRLQRLENKMETLIQLLQGKNDEKK